MSSKNGDSRRVQRVEKEVQQSVARFLIRDIQSEFPGLLTVTHVGMSGDLKTARISVSLFITEGEKEASMKEALKTLKAWTPEIQKHLSDELQLRFVPKLQFVEDEAMAKSLHIENLLAELKKK